MPFVGLLMPRSHVQHFNLVVSRSVDRPVPMETDREAKLFPGTIFCPEGTAGLGPGVPSKETASNVA
jgi:hypothetical protein